LKGPLGIDPGQELSSSADAIKSNERHRTALGAKVDLVAARRRPVLANCGNHTDKTIVTLKYLVLLATITFVIFGVGISLNTAAPAMAESPSYPWCAQGDIIRCWYMTREQCEEAVNYQGFCVTDPNVPRRYGEKIRG
jgi:hypothetical protein